MRSEKGVPRRFVPGNAAFKVGNKLPVVGKDEMQKIKYCGREANFRNVAGSDKFSGERAPPSEDEGEEEAAKGDDPVPQAFDPLMLVVFVWMELHPRARACL